jgi:hypothetical protein
LSFKLFLKHFGAIVEQWEAPATTLIKGTAGNIDDMINRVLDSSCDGYAALRTVLSEAVTKAVTQPWLCEAERLLQTLLYAKMHPATLNHYFCDNLGKIKSERISKMMFATFTEKDAEGDIRDNDQITVSKLQLESMLKTAAGVGVSNELQSAQQMADMLCAYWPVAYKRFVDQVMSLMDQKLVRPFADSARVRDAVMAYVDEHSDVSSCFQQSAAYVRKRRDLEHRLARLDKPCALIVDYQKKQPAF